MITLIPVFVHHTCVPSFSTVLLQIILPAHSKGLWFDNHSFSAAELHEKTWKRLRGSFLFFFFSHLETLQRLWRKLENVCINLCLCLARSFSLCPQTPLRRMVKMPHPHQTQPQTPLPHCSITGVTTWALKVEGLRSRSSVILATTATLATVSPSPGQSQTYDQTGQSFD